jgi:hypothetical protein
MQLAGIEETAEQVAALHRTWVILGEDDPPGRRAWRWQPEHSMGR